MPSFSPPAEHSLGAPSSGGSPTRSGASPAVRVFLTDDHPAVRLALRKAIEAEKDMDVCGEAASSGETLSQIEELVIEGLAPDVAIVDLSLGDAHGLGLVEDLQALETETLIYSMYAEEVYAEQAIRAGASGYLEKSEPVSCLIDAVRRASDGKLYLSRHMHRRLLEKEGLEKEGVAEGTSVLNFPIDQLTRRERQVFEMLGEAKTVEEIEDRLGVERITVQTHQRHVKEKLGCSSVNKLVQHALLRSLCKESLCKASPKESLGKKSLSKKKAERKS